MGFLERTLANMFEKNTLDELEYYALAEMAERGYPPDSVERTEHEILLHVDEEEETGAEIRVIPFGSENTNQKCIYCQEQSVSIPVFARGY